jgi:hypothetical protein
MIWGIENKMKKTKYTIRGIKILLHPDEDQPCYMDAHNTPVYLGHKCKIDDGFIVMSGMGGYYITKDFDMGERE